jgi:hypothetical protein
MESNTNTREKRAEMTSKPQIIDTIFGAYTDTIFGAIYNNKFIIAVRLPQARAHSNPINNCSKSLATVLQVCFGSKVGFKGFKIVGFNMVVKCVCALQSCASAFGSAFLRHTHLTGSEILALNLSTDITLQFSHTPKVVIVAGATSRENAPCLIYVTQ